MAHAGDHHSVNGKHSVGVNGVPKGRTTGPVTFLKPFKNDKTLTVSYFEILIKYIKSFV